MTFHEWWADLSHRLWPLAANHLWQATLVCCLVMAAILLLKSGPARARYGVWMIASLKFALPSALLFAIISLAGFDLDFFRPSPSAVEDSSAIEITLFDITDSSATVESPHRHNELYCALTLVWLAGFAFVLTRWFSKRVAFARAMRSGRAAESGRERAALRRVKSWLAVRRDIDLVLAPGIIEPGVWRIFRPVIVLPENISDHLSERELESVIMHELIHIERRDNLTATLQMILCAVFWFHPLVWMIDRKMLADRERACDEEVCRLGGQSGVYAASLLKVLQLCIGLKMAGVSSAAGSNLRRRIEEIMHNDTEKKSSAMHHALVGLLAFAVIAFTLASGLMSRDRVLAEQKVKERSSSVQGGVTGGVPGGVPGGVIDGVFGIAAVETQSGSVYRGEWQVRDLIDELKQAPDIPLQFDNDHQPPVTITEARMKAVRNLSVYKKQGEEWLPVADLYAVKPILLLTNNSAQRVSGYTLEFSGEDGSRSLHYTKAISPIEPNASFSIGEDWKRFISLYGDPSSFSVKVVRVLFDDGDSWGKMLPPPPPPPPPPPVYSSGRDVPPPPPVPVEGAKPPKVIRKSGGVLQGEAIRRAVPSYPEQAKEARVSGAVVVEITIDEEGNVINAQALSGHPMLRDAAIEAARQWKFAPTTLQEQPVKVIGTLTFNFTP